jgi:predicted nucleotidyltransferase
MLQQEVMIEKVRQLCDQDERVVATLMYGSFALGEGDRFSDIEFYLFFADEALDGLEEKVGPGQSIIKKATGRMEERVKNPAACN